MPIQRNKYLQPLSRDHHHGLLLCWKIKTGLKKQVESYRIHNYVTWFWTTELKPHFRIEESQVFPILGIDHQLIKTALLQHRNLTNLFENKEDVLNTLCLIKSELQAHIRFEERILFNEIQKIATTEQLKNIEMQHHNHNYIDNISDAFWE